MTSASSDDAVELTVVTLALEARDSGAVERLAQVLARYVVMTRGEAGCRNIDLCHSRGHPERFLVIEKWSSTEAHQAHVKGTNMAALAASGSRLLVGPPVADVLDAVSAHDLD